MAYVWQPPSFGEKGFYPAGSTVDAYGSSLTKDAFGRPLQPSFISPGSAFSGFTPLPLNPAVSSPAAPAPGENPYWTISNTKSEPIQEGINAILARAKGLTFDPATNTYVTRENVKSQPVQGQINSAVNQFGLDVNNSRQTLKDFVTQWQSGQAEAMANQKRDAASISNVYDPAGLEASLNKNARDQAIGLRQNLQLQLAQAGSAANRARMVRGDSSYIDAQNQGVISDAVMREALANSQLGRQNILEVARQRDASLGKSNTLLDQALGRGQLPITLSQMMYGNEASRLGQLTNTNASNNFYNLDSPTQQASQEAQLMAMIQQLNNTNKFYGLGAPRQEDLSGLSFPNYNIPLPRYPNVQPSPQGNPYGNPYQNPYQNPNTDPWGQQQDPNFGRNVLRGPLDWTDPANSGLTRDQLFEGDLAGISSLPPGVTRDPSGAYNLPNDFNYGNIGNPGQLYIPGWTPQYGPNPYE